MYKSLSWTEVSREFLYVSLSVLKIIFFALFWDGENKTNQNGEYTSDLYSDCISLVAFFNAYLVMIILLRYFQTVTEFALGTT